MVTSNNNENPLLFQTRNTEFSTVNSEEFRTLSTSGFLTPKSQSTLKTISSKDYIRKKLTARISPMTRNGGNDLVKKLDNEGKKARPNQTEKPSTCSAPTTATTTADRSSTALLQTTSVIVKRERQGVASCGESRLWSGHGKHKNIDRSDFEPHSKQPKLDDLPSASSYTPTAATASK